jgi:hypothetical protein
MKRIKWVNRAMIGVLGLALATLIGACGTTTKETTTYVPVAPAPQAVVQAPVEVPVPPMTTTSTTSNRSSNSSTSDPSAGTDYSSSTHHSESVTTAPSN